MMHSYCFEPFTGVAHTDEQIQTLLYKYGPTVGAIDAEGLRFMFLKKVYKGDCSKKVNHAIMIVGYTEKYWIVKNSWGSWWGENGLFYLERSQNRCGINSVTGVPSLTFI